MTVEIWSDVVCPWCYIGKRRFETALAGFAHKNEVSIVWRSFQLDPAAPRTGTGSTLDHLSGKYNVSQEQARGMMNRVSETAAAEGLEYHLETAPYSNTFDAHRLLHMAAARGVQDRMKERLLQAHFTENRAVGDHETLVGIAAEIGIDADEARTMLAGDAYADEVRADQSRGTSFGIQGVPFFVVDERYGISGAQSADVILETLTKAWASSHPLESVAGNSDGICEDGTCTPPARTA